MEEVQLKPEQRHAFGIDKLMSKLEVIREAEKRLLNDAVDDVFRLIVNEIPYASEMIFPTLAESLLADTPQTNLVLNDIVINLSKTICNPGFKDELTVLIQTYLRERKKTEASYAADVLNQVIDVKTLKPFPQQTHQTLKLLAQSILEKVINEKQLRKVPGYRLEPLIALVEPYIYAKLSSIELERLRAMHYRAYRKFVNAVAQDGYEKIIDDEKLKIVQKEKIAAFTALQEAVNKNTPLPINLDKFIEKIRYLEKDQLLKSQQLKKNLGAILTSINKLAKDLWGQLIPRFTEKLRRSLIQAGLNVAIYQTEAAIKEAHDKAFAETMNDVSAIKNLIQIIYSIRENYTKSIFRSFIGGSNLKVIEVTLHDVLLGKKYNYPRTSVAEIFLHMSNSLLSIANQTSGMFADNLKAEINRAISELKKATPAGTSVEKKPVVPSFVMPAESSLPTTETIEEPIKLAEPVLEAEPIVLEKTTVVEKPIELEPTKPSVDELIEQEKTSIVEEPIKFEETESPIEEEPVVLEKTSVVEEPIEQAKTEPSAAEEPILLEKTDLEKNEIVEEPISLEKIEPKPLAIEDFEIEEEPVNLEVLAPKPLLISEETITEPKIDATMQAELETGKSIMKNYQLGEMEKDVYLAWQKMIASNPDQESDILGLTADNEVHLYVICDLIQQVEAISVKNLAPEQQHILQNIKTKLKQALLDPLDEKNWDYFEGTQRDFIDNNLLILQS